MVEGARALPPLLAAALAYDAWISIEPLQHRPWLGALVVSGLLRARGKARHHLPCLNLALRRLPHERRRARDATTRWIAFLEAVALGAGQGIKDHDRWRLSRDVLERKLSGRRMHSKLPALVDFVLARPLVSAGMIAAELGVTARAAQDLVAALGLREITGRGRYRAWGVKTRGDHTSLGRPLGWPAEAPLLQDAGFQPFVDHPSNDAVRDSLVEQDLRDGRGRSCRNNS